MNKSILASSQWLDGKIQGKSVKWNQLVQNGNFDDTSGWSFNGGTFSASNNELVIIYNVEPRNHGPYTGISLTQNHKYISLLNFYSSISTTIGIGVGSSNFFYPQVSVGWNTIGYIITNANNTNTAFYVRPNQSGVVQIGDVFKLSKVIIIDLTTLFGAGNEPTTLAEFYATDLGKIVQAGKYLPYGSGILNATAPYVFKDANDNTLATYSRTSRVDLGSLNGYAVNYRYFISGTELGIDTASSNDNGYNCYCTKYKRQNGADLYYKNVQGLCLTSPFVGGNLIVYDSSFEGKTDAEIKALLSGVYLEYEPATQLELRAVGKELKSLLGKQNVSFITEPYSTIVYAKNNGGFDKTSTNLNQFNVINGHKYFLCFKADWDFSQYGNLYMYKAGSYQTISPKQQIAYQIRTATADEQSYIGIAGIDLTKVYYAIVIDLTSIGLDNLTAQQFYDNYNQYFEKLADGQTINTLCDTLSNCDGKVVRNVGTRAYQSGDENNPNYLTDGTTTNYPLATPTTEQHASLAIPKLATKCTDANGMEIDIERNN